MRTSVAALALIRRIEDGRTLWLAQWNEGWHGYAFVGGHKHDDETFRECVIREVIEELGLEEGRDFFVASGPVAHLEYTAWSKRAKENTRYTMELFDVQLVGAASEKVDGDSRNRWLSDAEIEDGRTDDGRAISPTVKDLLSRIGD